MVEFLNRLLNGAIGAGLVLVFLPSVGLYFGAAWLAGTPLVGLPLLAVFGVMILFGALALTASLFSKLDLSDRTQALALPEGSIRAAIALSLIVLFAIIAILLHQQAATPYVVSALDGAGKESIVQQNSQRVLAVVPKCNVQGLAVCDESHRVYDVHLLPPPTPELTDIAKQLLILIGTLVTSVVSFYFGSRSSELRSADDRPTDKANDKAVLSNRDAPHGDIRNVALDQDLPAATGGVEP